jgi:hypothetical protein
MKSNSELKDFNSLNNNEKFNVSKDLLLQEALKVAKNIDDLTSSSLKKVLKMVSHTHLADALLERKVDLALEEKEQKLIDNIFSLQELVFGHQALMQELNNLDKTNSGIGEVDLNVSLKEETNG